MSPEQVDCLPVDERTDIFALGLVAFEMMSGRLPFDEKEGFKTMNLLVNQDIPDPADVVPGIHSLFRNFIQKACARNPEDRYQTAQQALDALEPLSKKIGLNQWQAVHQRRKLSTLFLIYREDQRIALNRLMEDFSEKAQQIGVILRATDLKDI